MISQANIKWISQLSGVSVEEISGALSSEEEVTLGLRLNGVVKTQDEIKEIKEDSFKRGAEIRTKDLAKELSLSLDDGEHKDIKKVAEKLKETIETSLEDKYKNPQPGEKEKELEDKLLAANMKYDKLFETHGSILKTVKEKEKAFTELKMDIKSKERNNSVLKHLPEKLKQDRNDALIIINSTFEFDEVDGNQVIKRNGQIVTNDVGKPETLENIVPAFAEEKNWLKGSGMGGGDRNHSGNNSKGGKTPDEATKIVKEKFGENYTSSEGIKLFRELTAVAE